MNLWSFNIGFFIKKISSIFNDFWIVKLMKNVITRCETDCYYICKNHPIWELGEPRKIKNLDILVSSHQPNFFLRSQIMLS
jgi:hypothetical protein